MAQLMRPSPSWRAATVHFCLLPTSTPLARANSTRRFSLSIHTHQRNQRNDPRNANLPHNTKRTHQVKMGISNYGLWKATPTSWNGTGTHSFII